MIRPQVRLQLIVFAVVSLLGISYVGARYVGLGERFLGGGYTVAAELAASGGIFTGAEVTYRGVTVGRVGALHLVPKGVKVDLRLDPGTRIPRSTRAVVANRSAVGEQYVDLQPDTDSGPWLQAGAVIPRDRTAIPLPTETLLLNLDRLVNSVDRDDLRTVIDELGTAFAGSGPDLQRLVDASDALTTRAYEALPETLRLIDDGQTVLATQRADRDYILRWAGSLADLSDTLRASDADIRRLFVNGRASATELDALLTSTRSTLPVLLGNLVTVGQIQARRLPGLRQILVTYPIVVAGGFTVVPGDGTSHFGLVLNGDDPPPCTRGYGTTPTRVPQDTRETAANARAYCAEPQGSPTTVRGAQNAPRPAGSDAGPPPAAAASASGGSRGGGGAGGTPTFVAGYDPVTGQAAGPDGRTVVLGSTGGQQQVAGGQSWKWLLLGPMSGGSG